MITKKRFGDNSLISTKWCYMDNPNVKLKFNVQGLSTYNSLIIIGTFYDEVKKFVYSE